MAMRCFGRAFDAVFDAVFNGFLGLAAETRPFDLMVLRDEDLAAVLWPAHFFFTAVLAAALDVAFCLAIFVSSLFVRWEEANTKRISQGGLSEASPPEVFQ